MVKYKQKTKSKKESRIIANSSMLIDAVTAYIFMNVLAKEAERQYKKLPKKERQKTPLNEFVKEYIKNLKIVKK